MIEQADLGEAGEREAPAVARFVRLFQVQRIEPSFQVKEQRLKAFIKT